MSKDIRTKDKGQGTRDKGNGRVGSGVRNARVLDPLEPQVHVEGGHWSPLDQGGTRLHG